MPPEAAPFYPFGEFSGLAFYRQDDLPRALLSFDAAVGLAPGSAVAWGGRGVAHLELCFQARAEADLAEAARLDYARGAYAARKVP